MKTQKLIKSVFESGSGRTDGIIALVAGLAAGAVLSVLFAPESGKSARNKIYDAANRLFGRKADEKEEEVSTDNNSRHLAVVKKPKSDIKSIIHQARVQESHTEQGFS